MPHRKLPNTDEARYQALKAARDKKTATPGQTVIQSATVTKLDLKEPELKGLMNARAAALTAQTTQTSGVESGYVTVKMWFSQLIQHLNDAMARGEILEEARALYHIDVNDPTVPEITNYPDMKTWGQWLIDGEAARVLAGGTAMAFPTVNDFNTLHYAPWVVKLNTQSTAKVAYDNAQEAIEDKRADYDDLILRIWEEVELAFYNEESSSKRRKAREWGVVYAPDKGDKVTLTIAPNGTVTAEDFEIEDDMNFTGKNKSAAAIRLCRSTTANSACAAGVDFAANETKDFTSAQLGLTGAFLNGTNLDATIEGVIEVVRK